MRRPGCSSIFLLPCFQALRALPQFFEVSGPQCCFGAGFLKHTTFWASFPFRIPTECVHPIQWWRIPPTGQWHSGPHPPLRGKILAVQADLWTEEMARMTVPWNAPWLTRATAHYPPELNSTIADQLFQAARSAAVPGTMLSRNTSAAPSLAPSSSVHAIAPAPALCPTRQAGCTNLHHILRCPWMPHGI